MLANFFQLGPIPANEMIGNYNINLVILSYVVATFASYIALDLTNRLRDVNNTQLSSLLWLCGGAFAMGAGIWSMHFIGMLAFTMPGMSMMFEIGWTLVSLVVAILASGFALFLLKTKKIDVLHLVLGGIVFGIAIASMHYIGMHAMQNMVDIHYLPSIFFLSILIAIIASEAALYLALKSSQVISSMRFKLKFISAFIMGAAICGMHYTGMAAAVFTPQPMIDMNHVILNPPILAISIAGITFLILGIAVLISTHKEAQNQKMLAFARQAGMAEVAATVLHNVGNVLNTVNISAAMISEQINKSKLSELSLLDKLLSEHLDDLPDFLTKDSRGSQLPAYLKLLAEYWAKEQVILKQEIDMLIKNIQHIRTIISMQQELSKLKKIEDIVDIAATIKEALFITGLDNNLEILIEKEYKNLKPIMVDKVKLLQIIVNLLHNAKESIKEHTNLQKIIKINLDFTNSKQDKFFILISDNGIGIPAKNLTNIFAYGFTTKKDGHGFGLHSCAIAAKEMGGAIIVTSDGIGKGAQFKIELPYKLPH